MGKKTKVVLRREVVPPTSSNSSANAHSTTTGIGSDVVTPNLNVELTRNEYVDMIQRLKADYKKLAIKNLMEEKRVEHQSKEAAGLQTKNAEVKLELESVRSDHSSAELKMQKLQQLSQQLSNRLKTMDGKSVEDIKAEKEHRLRMSNSFSQSIQEISVKLESLSKRRETIVAENVRLKGLLREYLEEFDRDKEANKELDSEEELDDEKDEETEGKDAAEEEGAGQDGTTTSSRVEELGDDEVTSKNATDNAQHLPNQIDQSNADESSGLSPDGSAAAVEMQSATVEDVAVEELVEEKPVLSVEEQEALAAEAQAAADEARINELKEVEEALRAQAKQYMGVFDSFQNRLSQSNSVFQEKQSSIEALTKEIRALDKENKQFLVKISELNISNRGYELGNERLLKEKEKFSRASEKYQELINTFQTEIDGMEAQL